MSIKQIGILLLILFVGLACIFKAKTIPSFLMSKALSLEPKDHVKSSTTSSTNTTPPTTLPATYGRENNTSTLDHAHSNQNHNNNDTKYLQYFVSGGWSNQLACLASAYSIAWATNRTLILSPVVPQGKLHFRTVFDIAKSHTFRLDVDLRHLYHGFHLRLDQVLDVQAWNPPVPTIHFAEFYQHIYPTMDHPKTWVMETNYSHLNSQWIYRQPELVGQTQYIEAREYNIDFQYTVEARDLETIATTFQHYNIWTLLDSFHAIKHSPLLPIPFQPRFSSWIRQTAHRFLHDTIPYYYASVHIRGSDGPFKKPMAIKNAITQSLDQITQSILHWINNTSTSINQNNNPTKDTTTIGLFVATDIQQTLQSNPIFLQKMETLKQRIQDSKHSHFQSLKVVYGTDLTTSLQQLYQTKPTTLSSTSSSSFPFSDLKTPTIFLDQQIAACATIDFQGTSGSTFSNFIRQLRLNQSYSCSHP
jgi:hypothetical protein